MAKYIEHMMNGNKYFEFNKKAFPAYLEMIDNRTEFKLRKQLFNAIPLKILEFTSKLPIVGSTQIQN